MDKERLKELNAEFEKYHNRGLVPESEKKKWTVGKHNFDFLSEQDIKDQEYKTVKAFYNGMINASERGLLGALKAVRDVNIATKPQGDSDLKPGFDGVLEGTLASEHMQPYNVKGSSKGEQLWLDLAQGAGQLGAQAAVAVLTGGAGNMAFMGTQIAGDQYLGLTKEGVAPERAATAALANAAFQAPMEKLSLSKIMKRLPAGSGLRKKLMQIAESSFTEGATEFLQEYPEAITNIVAKNEDMTGTEFAKEFVDNAGTITKQAAYSGLVGAVLGGGASSIRVALQRNIQKAKVEKIEERANAIKQSGADPAYAASVINANLEGTTVAVDGEALYRYAQTQNINEVASDLGVDPETIKDAAVQGLDVEIMQGNLEATGAKRADFLPAIKNDLAFDNDGVTINNIQVQKELSKQSEALDAAEKEFAEWKDDQLGQMRNAGLNKEEALHTLALLESAARTYNPSDPAQYFRDHPLEIKRVVSTQNGRYIQTKGANEKLLEDEKNFSYLVDGLDKINESSTYHVMTTPLAMELAGGKLLPITIDGSKLKYIFDKHSDGMDKAILKQIPRAMTDPLMVLNSYAGRKIVVLDLKDKQGSTIIVPMELEVEKSWYKVNAINNAYGKGDAGGTNYDWFIEHNLKKGRIAYINKEKTAKWLPSPSSDSASRITDLDSLLTDSIPNENDLRKRKAEMEGYYQKWSKGGRLSVQTKSEEALLDKDEKAFAKEVDRFVQNTSVAGGNIKVMQTPLVLTLAGAKILPVEIKRKTLKKVLYGKHAYQMSPEIVKQIPRALTDPAAIFYSDTMPGRKNIIVALNVKDKNGSTIIVPFSLENDNGKYQLNLITSAYGKDDSLTHSVPRNSWFVEQVEKGNLKYINKEKFTQLFDPDERLLAHSLQKLDELHPALILKDENDLVKLKQGNPGYYQTGDEERGTITWDAQGKAIISLFKGSDPSTVIHEAVGHYFMENLMHDGARADAPEQMRKDRKIMLKYAGLTEEQWKVLDQPREVLTEEQWKQKTAAHERWAAAAEQYIMLGRAPSLELRRPMQRFKTWLLKTYETIQKFIEGNEYAVEITPEVAEVFDRLLASEKEIDEVVRVEGYFTKLPNTITDQLSDKSKNRLQDFILRARDEAVSLLQKKSLENFTEERKAQIAEYRAEILPAVQKEIAAQPLYTASKMLEEDFQKKSSRNIVNRYYELVHRTKSIDAKPLTDAEAVEVMHFDMLAEEMGFNPDELASRILTEPTYKEAVTKRADELVRDKFPDIMSERKAKAEAVKEALYNDDTGLVIATELQIIEDAAVGTLDKQSSAEEALNLVRAKRQQARAAAEAELAKMSIADATNIRRYMQAERRAFAKSIEFAAKKDYEKALVQKQLQAYHHAMVQGSAECKIKMEKQLAYVKRQRKAKKETWGEERHFFQAAELMRRMGIERKDYDPKQRKENLAEYVQDINENGDNNADIAVWLLDESVSLQATTKNFTTGQLQDIVDALRNIKAIGKYGKTVRVAEKNLSLTGVMDEILGELADRETKWEGGPNALKKEKGAVSHVKAYFAENENADTFFGKMDKWEENGIFTQVFRIPVQAAGDKEAHYSLQYDKAISDAIEELAPTLEQRNALACVEWNDKLQANVCRYNLIKMLAYLGTQSSSDKLCSTAETSTFKEFFAKSDLWIAGDLEGTRNNLLEFLGRTLTEKEIQYTQRIIDAANAPWSELQDVSRRTKGFAPQKEEALPAILTLANGKQMAFKGGYLPLVRYSDTGSKPRARKIADTSDERAMIQNFRVQSTVAGATKARDKSVYPLDLRADAEVFSVQETIHDLAFREAVDTYRKLLSNENVYRELKRTLGINRFRILLRYIDNACEAGGREDLGEAKELVVWANALRRKLTNVVILGNLKVLMQNLGNVVLYGGNVEGYSQTRALRAFAGFYKNIRHKGYWQQQTNFVYEKSSWMRERAKAPDFSLALVKEEQGRREGYKKFIQDVCVDAMVFTDNMTAIPVWVDAYYMKLNEGMTEPEAIRYADTVVRRALGATRVYDVAPIMRSGPWAKLFTMFQSFANARYNEAIREMGLIGKHIRKEEYEEAFKRALSYLIAKCFIFTGLSTALAFENSFEDDDDGWNKWLKELLLYPCTMQGPVGGFTSQLTSIAFGMRSLGYRITPIQSVPDQVIRLAKKAVKVQDGKGDLDDLAEPVAGVLGLYFEIPAQMNKLIFNAYDILYNDMTPRASDLIRRRPQRERDE